MLQAWGECAILWFVRSTRTQGAEEIRYASDPELIPASSSWSPMTSRPRC